MNPCRRKCYQCGHEADYPDDKLPECACKECGSADTRLRRTEVRTESVYVRHARNMGEHAIAELLEMIAAVHKVYGTKGTTDPREQLAEVVQALEQYEEEANQFETELKAVNAAMDDIRKLVN